MMCRLGVACIALVLVPLQVLALPDNSRCSRLVPYNVTEWRSYKSTCKQEYTSWFCWLPFSTCVEEQCVVNKTHVETRYQKEEYCCEGFKPADNDSCVPHCQQECENANCTQPDTCTCHEGYYNTSRYRCEPSCPKECLNGWCSAPNICSCNKGYREENATSCTPVGTQPCENGRCSAPNNCTCDPGYEKNGTLLRKIAEPSTGREAVSVPFVVFLTVVLLVIMLVSILLLAKALSIYRIWPFDNPHGRLCY